MENKLGEELMKTLIPNLKIDEQKRIVMQTMDVPLLINGEEVKVTLQKLTTGQRNKIRSECTNIKIIGGQPNVQVNDEEIQEKVLSTCIIKAPFEKSLNGIKALPDNVSDYLFEAYSNFAEPTAKKKD